MNKTLYVPHAIIFIYDPKESNVDIPEYEHNKLTAFSSSCISVVTIPDFEGKASVTLVDKASNDDIKGLTLVFSGSINTPNKTVGISTSEEEAFLSKTVNTQKTQVSIWANDPHSPTRIIIQVT